MRPGGGGRGAGRAPLHRRVRRRFPARGPGHCWSRPARAQTSLRDRPPHLRSCQSRAASQVASMDGAGPAGSLAGRPPSQGTPGLLHCWGRFWKRLSDLLTRARGGQKAPPSRRQQGDRSGQARAEATPPASGSCPRRLSASHSGLRCWPRGEPGPVPRFPHWPHLRPHVLGLGLPGTLSVGPVPRDAVALGVAPACPGPSTRFPGVQSWPASQPPFGTGPLGFAARQVRAMALRVPAAPRCGRWPTGAHPCSGLCPSRLPGRQCSPSSSHTLPWAAHLPSGGAEQGGRAGSAGGAGAQCPLAAWPL